MADLHDRRARAVPFEQFGLRLTQDLFRQCRRSRAEVVSATHSIALPLVFRIMPQCSTRAIRPKPRDHVFVGAAKAASSWDGTQETEKDRGCRRSYTRSRSSPLMRRVAGSRRARARSVQRRRSATRSIRAYRLARRRADAAAARSESAAVGATRTSPRSGKSRRFDQEMIATERDLVARDAAPQSAGAGR